MNYNNLRSVIDNSQPLTYDLYIKQLQSFTKGLANSQTTTCKAAVCDER